MFFVVVFFFKQKTAYEMRISDWSSDVCSSDLFEDEAVAVILGFQRVQNRGQGAGELDVDDGADDLGDAARGGASGRCLLKSGGLLRRCGFLGGSLLCRGGCGCHGLLPCLDSLQRSEEHTSELQSLMRISYAVFCLKTKKIQRYDTHI